MMVRETTKNKKGKVYRKQQGNSWKWIFSRCVAIDSINVTVEDHYISNFSKCSHTVQP